MDVTTAEPVPKTVGAEPLTSEADVKGGRIWGLLRLLLGWTFLWAFLDKTFALGYATGVDSITGVVTRFGDAAWINGGSPTSGYLEFATRGPLASFYQGLAGQSWLDGLFMLSLLILGLALLLGIGVRLASIGGIIWLALMYTSTMLPENNPITDDHIVQILVLAGIAYVGAGRYLGFGRRWEEVPIVKRHPILR